MEPDVTAPVNEIVPYSNGHSAIQAQPIIELDPATVLKRGAKIAGALMDVVEERKLYTNFNGNKYLRYEAWAIVCAFEQIDIRETSTKELENGDYEATVELVDKRTGNIVGRGSALVGNDEKNWRGRDRYARRSMAITRAAGKACRLKYGWIAPLAGYEATPAEEIDGLEGKAHGGSSPAPRSAGGGKPDHSVEREKTGPATEGKAYDRNDPVMQGILIKALEAKKVPMEFWDVIGDAMHGKTKSSLSSTIDQVLAAAKS